MPKEQDFTRTKTLKKLAFYAITIALSFILALIIVEIILRNLDYTSNLDTGKSAYERWMEKHWRVNELNYRDLLIAPRLSYQKPKVYFVGDSFTAGAGVDFKDTYYFKVGVQLESDYNFFNISQPGLSTLGEKSALLQFNEAINSKPDIVVHQYYVNDIEDYVPVPSWQPPSWLKPLERHFESAQLLDSYLINREWIENYKIALVNAYRTPSILEKHESDLKALHEHIRDDGGRVIFLAFPALGQSNIGDSAFVINEMRRFFSSTCHPNDIFIDATPTALSLAESRRIVSFLDHHPSPELHSLIANQIIKAIRRDNAGGGSYEAYETCESLKAAQVHSTEPQP